MASSQPPTCKTFLSPKVHHILCEVGATSAPSEKNSIKKDHLDFLFISNLLPGVELDEDSDFYNKCVKSLATVFKGCKEHLERVSLEKFLDKYEHDIKWTSSPESILKCFEYLISNDGSLMTLSLLMLTSVLERSLGDIYEMNGNQCPSLLKDLLSTNELKELFGAPVVQLLKVAIGPPISLNIRNVTWHGFAAPNEIPVQYGYFLLMMTVSLGHLLQSKAIPPNSIKHRQFVDFPQAQLLNGTLPVNLDLQSTQKVIESSDFVPKTMLPYISLALKKYREQSYGECLVLLFPQLEHGLRCAFSTCNNCEERMMTAESTVLYTTFDEVTPQVMLNSLFPVNCTIQSCAYRYEPALGAL